VIVANLPYLPDELKDHPTYAEYRVEPREAIFAPDNGMALYRRLLESAEERLDAEGALVIQFRRSILQAERQEVPLLRERLERAAVAAAA
jgi:methylase of polypeptide subunit release factors